MVSYRKHIARKLSSRSNDADIPSQVRASFHYSASMLSSTNLLYPLSCNITNLETKQYGPVRRRDKVYWPCSQRRTQGEGAARGPSPQYNIIVPVEVILRAENSGKSFWRSALRRIAPQTR